MSSINIARIAGLHQLLVSEGWLEDFRIKDTHGLVLFTHPEHDRRQLQLPVDQLRYTDWNECCERAATKLAEMTGRDLVAIWSAVDKRAHRDRIRRPRGVTASAFIALIVAIAGVLAWNKINSQPPVSIALAGCMDSEGAQAVARMGYDVHVDLPRDIEPMKKLTWARWRGLRAAANVEEMRKCYLEAQAYSGAFDRDGLIGDDMRRIEDGVKIVYAGIGASLVPGATVTEADRERARTAYREAEDAGNRISIRLGKIVTTWHL